MSPVNPIIAAGVPSETTPPPIESMLTRILGDADCWATDALRHGRTTGSRNSLRALFALNPDGRLVPLFPLGCYVGGAK